MSEQFNNFAAYQLSVACLAGDTTLSLVSVGGLATIGTFRMKLGAEILLVTAVDTVHSTLTVVRGAEGTTATGLPAGSQLEPILTAGALAQLKYDVGGTGNPALLVTDWYWDPGNVSGLASDASNGTSPSTPVLTFNGGLLSKMGTHQPRLPYGQSVIVHKLSAQPANQDYVVFEPFLSGPANCALLDTPTTIAGPVAAGTVTPQARGGPGTRLQIANAPAGTAHGDIIYNLNRDSYAVVDVMSGSTAIMGQPQQSAPLTTVGPPSIGGPSEVNTWATGDTITVYRTSPLNLRSWNPVGGEQTTGANGSTGWVQWSRVVSPDATLDSAYVQENRACANVFSLCRIDPDLNQMGNGGGAFGPGCWAIGCYVEFVEQVGPGTHVVGCVLPFGLAQWDGGRVDNDTIIHGSWQVFGDAGTNSSFCDATTVTISHCASLTVGGIVWGPAGMSVGVGAKYINGSLTGSFAVSVFLSGPLTFAGPGSATTGARFIAATGTLCSRIPLTIANLDAWGGLENPDTGGAFVMAQNLAPPTTPPTWTTPAWHLNGTTGNDITGDGSSGAPFQTYSKGLVPRWGTPCPQLAQATVLNVDGSQAVALESADVDVQLVGTAGSFTINGTPANLGGAFVPTSMTIETQGVAGTDWQMVVPAGAPTTNASAGVLVFNTTRNSWAYITNVAGSTVTLTRPQKFNVAPYGQFLVYDTSWVQTDTLQYQTVPVFNLLNSTPRGGSNPNSESNLQYAVRFLKVPDPSGTPGDSKVTFSPVGCVASMQLCWTDAFPAFTSCAAPGWNSGMVGCYCPSGASLNGSGQSGGLSSPGFAAVNCSAFNCFIGNVSFNLTVLDAEVRGCSVKGPVQFRGACGVSGHFTGAVTIGAGNTLLEYSTGNVDNGMWGAATVNVHYGTLANDSGQTMANMLRVSTLQLDGAVTGTKYVAGTLTDGVSLTAANIDSFGGLQNPKTGSRYAMAA